MIIEKIKEYLQLRYQLFILEVNNRLDRKIIVTQKKIEKTIEPIHSHLIDRPIGIHLGGFIELDDNLNLDDIFEEVIPEEPKRLSNDVDSGNQADTVSFQFPNNPKRIPNKVQ